MPITLLGVQLKSVSTSLNLLLRLPHSPNCVYRFYMNRFSRIILSFSFWERGGKHNFKHTTSEQNIEPSPE